jgi:hypothetical protein
MALTEKQREYVRHRAAGLPQTAAARAAGYTVKGAKVIASRLERDPKIRAAIEMSRRRHTRMPAAARTPREYSNPESYLRAVVAGETRADPIRVAAAKALLPFLEPRRRAPKRSVTPKEMDAANALAVEQDLLDE